LSENRRLFTGGILSATSLIVLFSLALDIPFPLLASEFRRALPLELIPVNRQRKGDITNIANPRIALCDEGMPRTARASVGGMWYHVLSRGNRREAVLYKPGDYDAVVEVIIDARARLPVHVLGYCRCPTIFTW
jgi:hypothetical protein